MKRPWFGIAFGIASFFAAMLILLAILDMRRAVETAQAERVENRFYFTDFSQLGQYTMAYVLHDRKRPGKCLLVVAMQLPGSAQAMTSQEWWCE